MITFRIGDLVKYNSSKSPLRFGYIDGKVHVDRFGTETVHAIDPYDNSPTIFDVSNIIKNYGNIKFSDFIHDYPEEQI